MMTAGIGWAGAEILLTRFLLLWVGARGTEFDWKYIQKCLESNINLVRKLILFKLRMFIYVTVNLINLVSKYNNSVIIHSNYIVHSIWLI